MLGIEHSQRGRELLGRCPGHRKATGREDNNPSWSINEETGAHHCFSCGYKGSVFSLVADLLQLESLDEAKSWIASNSPVDLETLSKELAELRRESNIYVPRPVPMSEARLAVFRDPPAWALDARGLSLDACQQHKVLWDNASRSWITPIRDPEDSRLIGWQQKGQGNRLFLNRPAGIKKASTLFGLETFRGGDMIAVESPLDVVRLTTLGISGGVSTFGARVSEEQIKLMRRADRLIVAMDNDDAGRASSSSILDSLRRLGMECWFFDYSATDAKDIGDMTITEVERGLSNARHCVLGLAAISQ
jgi:DNA primase